MMKVEDLNRMTCMKEGCNCDKNLLLISRCCEANPRVTYINDAQAIRLECGACDQFICMIAVAMGDESNK